MILRNVDFDNVFIASGALNFFGQGWPYHKIFKILFPGMFSFFGTTFISKTTTLNRRDGNMFLDSNFQPKEIFPKCIKIDFIKAIVLNSVGLSGPGAEALFKTKIWQAIQRPFFISFMSLGNSREEIIRETKEFINLMKFYLPDFSAPVGLQINISCPNTKHKIIEMIKNAIMILEIARELNIPIDLKIGVADSQMEFVKEIQDSGLCDCITCSNTIPWGKMSEVINWKKFFGTENSPLEHLGGGGLSGKPLLPIISAWISKARREGIIMPIKACGGILSKNDVMKIMFAGASAIELGCISILRPWRMQKVIQFANQISWSK